MPDLSATLYRLPNCGFGIRAKQLLEANGYAIDDHIFDSSDEAQSFMTKHDVETTPQVFIDDKRVGGSDDLEKYLSHHAHEDGLTTPNTLV